MNGCKSHVLKLLSILHPEASIKARQFHFSRLVTRLVTNSEKPLTLRLRMSCTEAPIAFHTMHTLCTVHAVC